MKMVDDLKKGHVEILESIDGLSSEEMTRPYAIGSWSVRDTMLHLAMWDGEALKAFAVWRTGHAIDWNYAKDYLKFNEFWMEHLRHLDINQVIQMFNLIRNALVCDTGAIPDNIYQQRGEPRWMYDVVIDHTAHHIVKLRAYRRSLGR